MDRRAVETLQLEPEGDVAGDVHVREQRVVLEHDVHVAPVRRHVGHVLAARAGCGRSSASRSRRACASVVDLPQPEGPRSVTNLPASMREVEVVDGDSAAVALGDVVEVDDGVHQRVLARRVRRSA